MPREFNDDPAILHDILDRAEVLHLALQDPEGPYVIPVNFVRVGERLFIHSGKEGRKIRNLRRDGRVGFSMCVDLELKRGDVACKWGYRFKSVVGSGQARFVEENSARQETMAALVRKYAGSDYFVDERIFEKTLILEIEILSATARVKS
jgi:hypothetical protein